MISPKTLSTWLPVTAALCLCLNLTATPASAYTLIVTNHTCASETSKTPVIENTSGSIFLDEAKCTADTDTLLLDQTLSGQPIEVTLKRVGGNTESAVIEPGKTWTSQNGNSFTEITIGPAGEKCAEGNDCFTLPSGIAEKDAPLNIDMNLTCQIIGFGTLFEPNKKLKNACVDTLN